MPDTYIDSIIPDSIYDQSAQAFDELINRIKDIDISPLLVYLIDTVPEDVLPLLAEQFHVLGYEGWAFVSTEEQKRQLIKNAITMHRYKGTPWSIKNSIKNLFKSLLITIYEGHMAMQYDNTCQYDRTHRHNPGDVFRFDVCIADTNYPFVEIQDPAQLVYNNTVRYNNAARYGNPLYRFVRANNAHEHLQIIINLINEYKNARSHLYRIYGEDEEYRGFIYDYTNKYEGKYRHIGQASLLIKSILYEGG